MSGCELIVLGGSWGGMQAVTEILGGLPVRLGAPVVVVLHRGPTSGDMLSALLGRATELEVHEAEDKAALVPGRVLVAPPGYHLLVERGHVALSTDAAVLHSRPSIDVALETAADAYGAGVVGVVLTGANADGAAGLAEVRRRGGTAIVQDPSSAESPAMPMAAVATARPQAVLPLGEIAPMLAMLSAAQIGEAEGADH